MAVVDTSVLRAIAAFGNKNEVVVAVREYGIGASKCRF